MKTTTAEYRAAMRQQVRPKGYMRITLASGGTTYEFEDDVIIKAIRLEDVDPLSRRLPKERFEFSVLDFAGQYNPGNPSGKWEALDENATIAVEYGLWDDEESEIYWLPDSDVYMLDGRPEYDAGIAAFSASSALLHATGKYYKGTATQTSLYALATAILEDAGFISGYYYVDTSLQQVSTSAPVPVETHRNLLQMIAHAGGCILHTVSGVVRLDQLDLASLVYHTDTMTKLDIRLDEDSLSKIEPLAKVQAYRYFYTKAEAESAIYSAVVSTIGGETIHIEYDAAADVSIASSSGTLTVLGLYARAADFSISEPGAYEITVTGKRITQTAELATANMGANTGGTDVENNRLVTDDLTRSLLIYRVANYLRYRITHTIGTRGNPEQEPGDGLHFITDYDVSADGLILTNTLTYDGAFSGEIIVKSLTEGTFASSTLYDADDKRVIDDDAFPVSVVGTGTYTSAYTGAQMDSFVTAVLGY